MSLARALRILAEKRRQDKALRERRRITKARSEAALRGVSTEWKRRGEACRRQFNLI